MIYLYILKHTKSGLLWVGKTSVNPTKELPQPKHWKWQELLEQSPKVELLQVRAFRDPEKAAKRMREFRKEQRVRTSARWVNSNCYLDKQTPYVYMIRHRETGQLYVGSSYSKKRANPSLFFKNYWTSSHKVKALGWETFDLLEIKASKSARAREANLLQRWYHELGKDGFIAHLLNRSTAPGIIQDAAAIAAATEKRRVKWSNKSDEERTLIAASTAATWEAKSESAKASWQARMSASTKIVWENRGAAERAVIRVRMAEAQQTRSSQYRAEIEARRAATRRNKTEVEKAETKRRMSEATTRAWAEKSEEEMAEINARKSRATTLVWANRRARAQVGAPYPYYG